MYLTLRYVPGPRTMFRHIQRLQPGHVLVAEGRGVHVRKYWDLDYAPWQVAAPEETLERFRTMLEESVRMRLISEVPLGVFLSGGLDSSAILAVMSKLAGGDKVKTFSVGYEAQGAEAEAANEFHYARLATQRFAAEHHEFRLDAASFAEFLPEMVRYLDEPLADPSCIPLYFISRLAREHITVVLSGEGADEILAGYGIYGRMLAIERLQTKAGRLARLASRAARFLPTEKLRHYARMCGEPLETRYRGVARGFTAEGLARLVGRRRAQRAQAAVGGVYGDYFQRVAGASPLDRMLYVDAKVWLPDDLLAKADRMTMANGLELRVPFLDHELVEFAATLPASQKIRGPGGKTVLRAAMRGILPDAILDRPKQGFPVPLASWLRTSLRHFMQDQLLTSDSACGRFLDRSEIARLLREHQMEEADRSQEIWTLLVFEFWHRRYIGEPRQPAAPAPPEVRQGAETLSRKAAS